MELTRENVAALIGAVVAVLLQIMVAPAIALFSAIPNFIVAFCVVRAVAAPCTAPYQAGSLIPLALGLVFDLVGGGPVGGMAFVLVLVTFFASRLFAALNNDTLFMPVTIILVSTMLVEVLYGLVVVACGAGVSFGEALLYRVLPCMLYDCVIGLLLYPIAIRVLVEKPLGQPGTPVLR